MTADETYDAVLGIVWDYDRGMLDVQTAANKLWKLALQAADDARQRVSAETMDD